MRVLYIAEDGTEFNNSFDCEIYEWECKYRKEFDRLIIRDADGNRLDDICKDETYNNFSTIQVPKDFDTRLFHELYNMYGWELEDIDYPGIWKWDIEKQKIVYDGGMR